MDRLRAADLREDLRALFRPPFFAALARFAPLRPLFLALFRADFFPARFADRLAAFLRGRLAGLEVRSRLGVGSSAWPYEGVEAGVGEGVLSIGSGSIHPEPDQPISMK